MYTVVRCYLNLVSITFFRLSSHFFRQKLQFIIGGLFIVHDTKLEKGDGKLILRELLYM